MPGPSSIRPSADAVASPMADDPPVTVAGWHALPTTRIWAFQRAIAERLRRADPATPDPGLAPVLTAVIRHRLSCRHPWDDAVCDGAIVGGAADALCRGALGAGPDVVALAATISASGTADDGALRDAARSLANRFMEDEVPAAVDPVDAMAIAATAVGHHRTAGTRDEILERDMPGVVGRLAATGGDPRIAGFLLEAMAGGGPSTAWSGRIAEAAIGRALIAKEPWADAMAAGLLGSPSPVLVAAGLRAIRVGGAAMRHVDGLLALAERRAPASARFASDANLPNDVRGVACFTPVLEDLAAGLAGLPAAVPAPMTGGDAEGRRRLAAVIGDRRRCKVAGIGEWGRLRVAAALCGGRAGPRTADPDSWQASEAWELPIRPGPGDPTADACVDRAALIAAGVDPWTSEDADDAVHLLAAAKLLDPAGCDGRLAAHLGGSSLALAALAPEAAADAERAMGLAP